MRLNSLYLAGAAVHVPGRIRLADAIAAGRCDERSAARTALKSVGVSTDESAAELAARAADLALKRADSSPAEIALILHADVYYQGHDLWAPASYVQRVAVGNRCPAIEIRQLSNGGMSAIELAGAYLTAAPGRSAALLTTGDRFCPPGFDRWNSDPGTIYGDAGTALVMSREGGFAALRSLATVSEPELEGVHRGADPFGPAPFSRRQPMDLDVLKRDFAGRAGISAIVSRVAAGQAEALNRALADAGVTLADIDRFVLPHFGLRRLTSAYLRPWNIDLAATTWLWASRVGHLGAGDQFSGVCHLVESRSMQPGDHILLAGVGAGYTWTCAVVEILSVPDWSG